MRRLAVALVAAVALAPVGACADGRPAFCDDLGRAEALTDLRRHLASGRLDRAERSAERFAALADAAPAEIAEDLAALGAGVTALVAQLRADRADAGSADAEAAAARREELGRQLSVLGRRSSRVEAWAARECGLDLGADPPG